VWGEDWEGGRGGGEGGEEGRRGKARRDMSWGSRVTRKPSVATRTREHASDEEGGREGERERGSEGKRERGTGRQRGGTGAHGARTQHHFLARPSGVGSNSSPSLIRTSVPPPQPPSSVSPPTGGSVSLAGPVSAVVVVTGFLFRLKRCSPGCCARERPTGGQEMRGREGGRVVGRQGGRAGGGERGRAQRSV
jgi:hypothetical protein